MSRWPAAAAAAAAAHRAAIRPLWPFGVPRNVLSISPLCADVRTFRCSSQGHVLLDSFGGRACNAAGGGQPIMYGKQQHRLSRSSSAEPTELLAAIKKSLPTQLPPLDSHTIAKLKVGAQAVAQQAGLGPSTQLGLGSRRLPPPLLHRTPLHPSGCCHPSHVHNPGASAEEGSGPAAASQPLGQAGAAWRAPGEQQLCGIVTCR